MITKTPMTMKGHQTLQEELQRLKSEERPKIIKALEEARAHGDLSENAEYDAAKNAQGMLEGRIRDIESKLSNAQIIDISSLSGDKVMFGATVRVLDADSGTERIIQIVGEDEADADNGLISYSSPLARALIGRKIDDFVQVRLPAGEKEYEILEISFSLEVICVEK